MSRPLVGVAHAPPARASYGPRRGERALVVGVPEAWSATCAPDLYRQHPVEDRCAGLGASNGAT